MTGALAGTTGARSDARVGMIVATTGAQGARHHNRNNRSVRRIWRRSGGARPSSHRLEGCSPAAAPHSRRTRPSTGLRGGGGGQSRQGRRNTIDRVCAEARAESGVDPHRRSRDDAAQVRSSDFKSDRRCFFRLNIDPASARACDEPCHQERAVRGILLRALSRIDAERSLNQQHAKGREPPAGVSTYSSTCSSRWFAPAPSCLMRAA